MSLLHGQRQWKMLANTLVSWNRYFRCLSCKNLVAHSSCYPFWTLCLYMHICMNALATVLHGTWWLLNCWRVKRRQKKIDKINEPFYLYISFGVLWQHFLSYLKQMGTVIDFFSSEHLQIVQDWETKKPWLLKDKIDEVLDHIFFDLDPT